MAHLHLRTGIYSDFAPSYARRKQVENEVFFSGAHLMYFLVEGRTYLGPVARLFGPEYRDASLRTGRTGGVGAVAGRGTGRASLPLNQMTSTSPREKRYLVQC